MLSVLRPGASGGFATKYVHSDALGSVRALTDEGGAVTDRWSYSAFGSLLERTGTDPLPYGFAGEAFEPASGLAYHRLRWMDPHTGRFLSMDPFDGMDTRPGTLHDYVYGLNDPVNRMDPSGAFADFSVAGVMTFTTMMNTLNTMSVLPPRAAEVALRRGGGRRIQLTVDDGPLGSGGAMRALLREHGIHTMFFVVGEEVATPAGNEEVRALLREGHSLGNHSWGHEALKRLSKAGVTLSLLKADRAVKKATGLSMAPHWRAPYGGSNATVEAGAAAAGFTVHWPWDIDSMDALGLDSDPQGMLRHIRRELGRRAKSPVQILFHDKKSSVSALRLIIPALENEGHTFVDFP
ncbi:polysaccharide deacetylase family protein [Myxococcaceae bacterium GXIMD 01537]